VTRFVGVTLGCALLVVLAFAFAPRAVGKMPDFEVYWTAAVRARGGEALYRIEDGHYQFKYLPAFAVLAIPVGLLPLEIAKTLWFAGSVALLVAAIALSITLLPQRMKPPWMIAAIVVLAMGKFYGHELVLGQVNVLFTVVVLMALHSVTVAREPMAGLLFALAVVVKPYAVLFAPWLAARRRFRAIAAFLAALLAVLALPVTLYGLDGTVALHLEWWRTVAESTAPNLTNADNVSIAGMYSKWFGDTTFVRPLVIATSLFLITGAAFAVVRGRGLRQPHVLEGALLLTLVPLLSPQGWDYVFLVSTPAIALLANYEERLPRLLRVLAAAAILIVGLSLYDVMGRVNYAVFMSMSVITICFLVIVGALTALRLRGVA
jgi:hypothetical protein